VSVRVHSASFDSVDSRLKSSEASVDGEENDGSKKKKKKKKLFFFRKKSKVIYKSLFALVLTYNFQLTFYSNVTQTC